MSKINEIAEILEDVQNNDLDEEGVISSQIIDKAAEEAEKSEEEYMIVSTSGTTGEPTQIPYYQNQLDRQAEIAADCFRLAGIDDEDVVLNLGAPQPHFSQWAIENGVEKIGAELVNKSYGDYSNVVGTEDAEKVTTTITLPRVALSVSNEIEEMDNGYDSAAEAFPNAEKGIFAGEIFTDYLRESLEDEWEFDEQREAYAASEANFLAVAPDESRKMVPLLNHYVMEVIPEGEDEPVDIREVEEFTKGLMILTDPERELWSNDDFSLDFTRYDIGDGIEVTPGNEYEDGFPRIEIRGKGSTCLNAGGAQIYDTGIHNSIATGLGYDEDDWRAVKTREDDDLWAHFYVPNYDSFDYESFFDSLYNSSPAMEEADKLDVVHGIDIHPRASYGIKEEQGMKKMRIKDQTA